MSCHTCRSNPCACQGTSGTVWQAPSPGSIAVLPFGSKAIQTPQKYPCNTEQMQATAVISNQGGASQNPALTAAVSSYPILSAQITIPTVGLQSQLRSPNASQWALPGLAVWIPPFGNIEVLGVTGDLVTYKNLSIPSGTTIGEGAILVPFGPSPGVQGVAGAAVQTLFDTMNGFARTNYTLLGVPDDAKYGIVAVNITSETALSSAVEVILYGYFGETLATEVPIARIFGENAINAVHAGTVVLPIYQRTIAMRLVKNAISGSRPTHMSAKLLHWF